MARPPKKFTKEQITEIERMAFLNCHIETIARALGTTDETIRKHFSPLIKQKRAEGRVALRQTQRTLAKSAPGVAIFLGKNELGQADVQDHKVKVTFAQIAALALEVGDNPVDKENQ